MVLPLVTGGLVLLVEGPPLLLALSVIWIAHIGMDRMFGFGLKLPDSFRRTHLQRIS
jgi:hypothetical protein